MQFRALNVILCLGAAFAVVFQLAPPARAIRPFTLVEDGYPEAPGQLELENTLSTSFRTNEDHSFRNFAIENELEYGLNEHFTARVKAAYFYQDSHEFTGMHFDDAGVEGQYFFTNPNIDDVGISVIGAVSAGERTITLESFAVVQKDLKDWILAYNLGIAAEFDGAFHAGDGVETTVTITNAIGAVYLFTPTLRAGAEASLESSYESARTYAGSNLFAGPVISWIPNDKIWITAGFNVQLTNADDEPRYVATIVVGYFF
jgi:hypothetical protein